MLDYTQLKEILPQAYPFLLIDRVEEVEAGKSLVAIKNITSDEWFFQNGSNDTQYFPETLMIEAAAQAALVLYHISKVKEGQRRSTYFLGRTKAEFFRPVGVEEQMRIQVVSGKMLDFGGYTDARILGCFFWCRSNGAIF